MLIRLFQQSTACGVLVRAGAEATRPRRAEPGRQAGKMPSGLVVGGMRQLRELPRI
jgi:hypothetical protein